MLPKQGTVTKEMKCMLDLHTWKGTFRTILRRSLIVRESTNISVTPNVCRKEKRVTSTMRLPERESLYNIVILAVFSYRTNFYLWLSRFPGEKWSHWIYNVFSRWSWSYTVSQKLTAEMHIRSSRVPNSLTMNDVLARHYYKAYWMSHCRF